MSWRWRKSIRTGPFRINITKRGVGYSVGIPGLRYGRSPQGRKYVSQSIPGTGLYRIKYLGANARGRNQPTLPPQTTVPMPTPIPAPAPRLPSPVPRASGQTIAAFSSGIAIAFRALVGLVARAYSWSTDQISTAVLRHRSRGWLPPAAPPAPVTPVAPAAQLPRASAAPTPPIPATSWLPQQNPVAQPSPSPMGPPAAPAGTAAVTPVEPWWKQKPPP